MSELSRPLAVDRIGSADLEQVVEATAAELAQITRRLMIPAVTRLRCTFHLRRVLAGVIEARGELAADVVQTCVVSLDEFPQDVRETFTLEFVPVGAESEDDDPEAPDQIPYEGGAIDLGEAAVEQLALALDPYPRKPGAEEQAVEPGESPTPFAALAALRRRQ
jgi:uncharacterized metal-binding protein YceD (DUF177 family)